MHARVGVAWAVCHESVGRVTYGPGHAHECLHISQFPSITVLLYGLDVEATDCIDFKDFKGKIPVRAMSPSLSRQPAITLPTLHAMFYRVLLVIYYHLNGV